MTSASQSISQSVVVSETTKMEATTSQVVTQVTSQAIAQAADSTYYKLGFPKTRELLNKEATSDNCVLAALERTAYVAASAFVGVAEFFQNIGCAVVNAAIWATRSICALFASETPVVSTSATAVTEPTKEDVAPAVVVPAARSYTQQAFDRAKSAATTTFNGVKGAATAARNFVMGHKTGTTATAVVGTAAGVGAYKAYPIAMAALGAYPGATTAVPLSIPVAASLGLAPIAIAIAAGYAANKIANRA